MESVACAAEKERNSGEINKEKKKDRAQMRPRPTKCASDSASLQSLGSGTHTL